MVVAVVGHHRQTVVHLMCLRGNIEGVRELLARRLVADIDARNTHGDTALHYGTYPYHAPPWGSQHGRLAGSRNGAASRKGYQEIVRLLVAHGASPAAESQFGTPVQVASESRQDHIADPLRSPAPHQPDDDDSDDERLGLWSLPPVRRRRCLTISTPRLTSPRSSVRRRWSCAGGGGARAVVCGQRSRPLLGLSGAQQHR
jgi:hypothetical protein